MTLKKENLQKTHLHKWWNKLYIWQKQWDTYRGPGATEIPETKEYVIRPHLQLRWNGYLHNNQNFRKG